MTPPTTHGGKRRGAGRPPQDQRGKAVLVYIKTPAQLEWYYRNGRSQGVQRLIDEAIEKGETADEEGATDQ